MAREIGSWLSGPESAQPRGQPGYPGQAFGLPENGPRSLSGMGRRFAALIIDWFISYGLAGLLIAAGVVRASMLSTAVLTIWFLIGVISVRLFGFTPGQYALGLMVVPLDNRLHVGAGRAIARGLLIALVIPPLFTDSDGRGLHDRLTATAVVRR